MLAVDEAEVAAAQFLDARQSTLFKPMRFNFAGQFPPRLWRNGHSRGGSSVLDCFPVQPRSSRGDQMGRSRERPFFLRRGSLLDRAIAAAPKTSASRIAGSRMSGASCRSGPHDPWMR